MIRSLKILYIVPCLALFSACHANKEAPADDMTEVKEASGPKATDLNAEIIRKNDESMDKALLDDIRNRDTLPPIGSTLMEVVSTNDRISMEDAERSFLFRKSVVDNCYRIALARDENAKGQVEMTLKREAGSEKAVLERMETDIKTEKFEDCMRNSVDRWPLPEGAQISVRIRFSSRPAPSVEELKRMGRENHHEGHEDHHHP